MLHGSVAAPLLVLATALPFLFPYTHPPSTSFWPLMFTWLCGWVVAVAAWGFAGTGSPARSWPAALLAAGLLLAALLASAIGLSQYFGLTVEMDPWIHPSTPGVAMGQLRQRNQQATLLSMGVWALLWVVAQTVVLVDGKGPSTAGQVNPRACGSKACGGVAVLAGSVAVWGLALLALGGAATASRTALAQWIAMLVMLLLWRASLGRLALGLALAGLLMFVAAAWALPGVLLEWTGFRAEGLFARFGDAPGCTSRRVLWSNVLHLIAQKPWLGWGWGELDYAHYVTLFPGERFCVLLDNAHNLPLHLAVELGVPVAALLCFAVLAWVWKARPWSETDPARQLAWGILALVGLHSMLEFPLWYGPFQIVTLLAVGILWRWPVRGRAPQGPEKFRQKWPLALAAKALIAILTIAFMGYASWDYWRVSQVYRPAEKRPPSLRHDTLAKVSGSWLFANAVDFAALTLTPVSAATAERVHGLATRMLHYSPEPRVIEPLIESAVLLGRDDEAAFHLQRYRVAYPKDHARWQAKNRASAADPASSVGSEAR
jgi:O-antigen ligase